MLLFAAGEVWFLGKNTVYLNAKSARFGGSSITLEQYNASIDYWKKLGYSVEAAEFKPPAPKTGN